MNRAAKARASLVRHDDGESQSHASGDVGVGRDGALSASSPDTFTINPSPDWGDFVAIAAAEKMSRGAKRVRWYCPTHGFLVETSPRAVVLCGASVKERGRVRRCNKRATTTRPERSAA